MHHTHLHTKTHTQAQTSHRGGRLLPCHSFAHALSLCVRQHALEQQGVDVVGSLESSAAYSTLFLGSNEAGEGDTCNRLHQELLTLKRRANHENFKPTHAAPLLVLVQGLQGFFGQFKGPALSQVCVCARVSDGVQIRVLCSV